MPNQRATILFLCTGNSARSIMAEAIERFTNRSVEIDLYRQQFGHIKTV